MIGKQWAAISENKESIDKILTEWLKSNIYKSTDNAKSKMRELPLKDASPIFVTFSPVIPDDFLSNMKNKIDVFSS